MKWWKYTIVLLYVTCFSCTKNKDLLSESSSLPVAGMSSGADKVSDLTVTGWESGFSWNRSDSGDYAVFTHDRPMPALTASVVSSGAVLIWAKNIPIDNGVYEKPVQLPFAALPDLGRPKYNEYYYWAKSIGLLQAKFRTNKGLFGYPVTAPPSGVQFRFFIIPEEDLKRLGHSSISIARLTYSELVGLLGVGS